MIAIDGKTIYIKEKPAKVWGLRVASAAVDDRSTEQLIAALDEYQSYGVNMFIVFYQGSSGGYPTAFSGDGTAIDENIKDNLAAIHSACARRGLLLQAGLFYNNGMKEGGEWLESREAYLEAARVAASHLKGLAGKDGNNIIINIVNEADNWDGCPVQFGELEELGAISNAIKEVWPEALVGAGGIHNRVKELNRAIGLDPRFDLLLWDTCVGEEADVEKYKEAHCFHREQGVSKPEIYVESFGWTAGGFKTIGGETLFGVWPENGYHPEDDGQVMSKENYYSAIEYAEHEPDFHLCGHFQSWFQSVSRGDAANHFEVGGNGTPDDPGIRWYLERIGATNRKQETEYRKQGPSSCPVSYYKNSGV